MRRDFSAPERTIRKTYLDLLSEELRKRKDRNSHYSLRAFAAYLEIHPSALSRILNGKQSLALRTAKKIIDKLKLEPADAEIFIRSIINEKLVKLEQTANGLRLVGPQLEAQ